MTKITIAMEGSDLKEFELTKQRTTIGRRPYNDIVIDHLAVSGEHAVFLQTDGQLLIEDLHSTNGTYVNGRAVRTAAVGADDLIEIGRYKIHVLPGAPAPAVTDATTRLVAKVRVVSGPAAGREMTLTKPVTTLGKPGVCVAAITHRGNGYSVAQVDGDQPPTVNGRPFDATPVPLHGGEVMVLAGTEMRFVLEPGTP